jgi:hypothetical protein
VKKSKTPETKKDQTKAVRLQDSITKVLSLPVAMTFCRIVSLNGNVFIQARASAGGEKACPATFTQGSAAPERSLTFGTARTSAIGAKLRARCKENILSFRAGEIIPVRRHIYIDPTSTWPCPRDYGVLYVAQLNHLL